MKFGLGVVIKGMEELSRTLDKKTITGPLADGIRDITLTLQEQVSMATPVKTTRLRSSIRAEVKPLYGKVGTIVEYASAVEYGSGKMEPRHVTEGSSIRVLGEGPFSYGLGKLRENLSEHLQKIMDKITVQWKR